MKESFSKFDFYRGVSAVVVVLAHACQVFLYNIELVSDYKFYISNLAVFAVVLFFLLSGFLVTKSIISNYRKYSRFDWIDYLSSRLARIYPPFIFSMVVVFFVYLVICWLGLPGSAINPFSEKISSSFGREIYSISVREYFSSFLMMGGLHSLNGPLWSLYYEFQLYILAMLLSCGLLNKKVVPLMTFFVLFILLFYLRVEFLVYSFIWFLGASIALFGARQWCKRLLLVFGSLGFILVVTVAGFGLHENYFWGGEFWFVGVLSMAILFSIIIFYMDFAFSGIFVRVADFSYTLYIVHFPLMSFTLSVAVLLGEGDSLWWGGAVIGVSLSFVISWVAARYLERAKLFKPHFCYLLKMGEGAIRRGAVRLY